MKSISLGLSLCMVLSGTSSWASIYHCTAYKANWYGVTALTKKDSRTDQICGHAVLDSSTTAESTTYMEQCDSLVISINDTGLSNLGSGTQEAQVRLLKPGKPADWMIRNFSKQTTLEGLPLPDIFRLDLALDVSNPLQDKNVSYGVTCKIVKR